MQSCRSDTDTIYSSVSDPLPKSCVAFLGTDLDQIGSSSDSKRRILLCNVTMKGTEVPNPRRSSACDCTCVLTRN